MNNSDQPGKANDPFGIITSAEQLVAELWKDEKGEEGSPTTPPGSEAVEDEVEALRVAINADIMQMAQESGSPDMKLHCRILDVDRFTGADVPLWGVGGCIEGHCGDPECRKRHHSLQRFFVTKRHDGSYVVLAHEEIMNVRKQHKECTQSPFAGAIQVNLDDIVGQAVQDAVSQQLKGKEKAEKNGGDDDDDLPPAAAAQESLSDEDLLGQFKAFMDRPLSNDEGQRLRDVGSRLEKRLEVLREQEAAKANDDTERLPVARIEAYRRVEAPCENEEKPGWFRCLVNWLRRSW